MPPYFSTTDFVLLFHIKEADLLKIFALYLWSKQFWCADAEEVIEVWKNEIATMLQDDSSFWGTLAFQVEGIVYIFKGLKNLDAWVPPEISRPKLFWGHRIDELTKQLSKSFFKSSVIVL